MLKEKKITEPKKVTNYPMLCSGRIVYGTQQSHLDDCSSARHVGHCYQCDYNGHTRKNCPLSYCTHCNAYGHIFSVCPQRKKQELITSTQSFRRLPSLPTYMKSPGHNGLSLPIDGQHD